MRLLLNLILSLTDEEAARLAVLKLRGKQRAMMNIILATRSSGVEPSQAEIDKLGLSDSHLYQITSVLLDKCEELLVPEGGKALLEFFAYKNLHILFKQELRRQQKQLQDHKGKAAEDFYLTSFELALRFSHNLLDKALIAEYGKLYLASKKNKTPEDELAIKTRMLLIEMTGILAEGKNIKKGMETAAQTLQEFEKLARNSSHSYFSFSLYSAFAWYWQNLGMKPELSLRYIQRAIPFAEKLEGFVFREIPEEMQLRLADAHFILGGADQAIEIFDKVYLHARPGSMLWRRNYYLLRYLAILIYNGKYSRAEQILKKYFEPGFVRPTTSSATAASLLAMLYLFSEDFTKALCYLKIGIALNTKKNFTLYNEVRNRYIEAAYYYLSGDWEYAQMLAHRAVQYLYGKGLGLNNHSFGYYFKIIEATIEFNTSKKAFPKKLEEKYKELTKPQEGLFGLLLKKMRTRKA